MSVASRTLYVHTQFMATGDTQFKLIIPADLKKRLDEAADGSRRSLSAEIVARLEQSFNPAASTSPLDTLVSDMVKRIARSGGLDPSLKEDFEAITERYEKLKAKDAKNVREFMYLTMNLVTRNKAKAPDERFLGASELARLWGVSVKQIERLVIEGRLVAVGEGENLRIDRSSIDHFVSERGMIQSDMFDG